MLTADQLDSLTDPIVALYSEYEQSVINDIARRLSKMGMSSASAWQIQRLIESGGVYKNAIAQIAKLTGQSEKDLRAMFEKAGVKSMKFDDSIYKAAGLNPLPLNMSPAMAQVLAAGLRKTQGILSNLTLTTAMSGQQAFIKAADMAYLQVSTGAMSYDQAIQYAVKQMADGGLKVINYASGHVDKIDVATRRAVLTGVSQTTGNLQMARADQMGVDLVQTSAHGGARPSHQLWQGKIFSRSGTNKKYPDFVAETGYGTGPGLMGWNCRHSFFPFFEGISENAYNQATLDDYASTTVKLNGQDVPMYDATQYQRGIERKIRYWKRQADALGSAGQDNTGELAKVKEWQSRARAFVKETGLYRQPAREKVYLGKGNGNIAPAVVKPIEKPKLPIYKPDETLEKRLIEETSHIVAEEMDWQPDKIKSEFESKFLSLVTDEKTLFASRVKYKNALTLVQDGRFKTQFETNASGGTLNQKTRAEAEYNGIGIPKDIDPKLRPIYGYVKRSDFYIFDEDQAIRYGDIQFVFKKDKILNRTTFTLGDSLGAMYQKEATASQLLNPKVSSTAKYNVLQDFLNNDGLNDYIEIQIQNGVTLDNVDSVIIPKKYEGNDALGDLLTNKGIKVIYE